MPLAVLGRRAVSVAVEGDAAQEEVQVVLEGDADAAVELHAVLQQLGAVLADVRLGDADQLGRVGGAVGHGPGRGVADGVARLEPASSCRRSGA